MPNQRTTQTITVTRGRLNIRSSFGEPHAHMMPPSSAASWLISLAGASELRSDVGKSHASPTIATPKSQLQPT